MLGFSAGGHLVVILGNHPDFQRPNAPASESAISARPDFIVVIYPAYLTDAPALTQLAKGIDPNKDTPPTFLLQAEDDPVHVENVLVYAQALKQLKVPTELHVYAEGGHGYGLRPAALPAHSLAISRRDMAAHRPHSSHCTLKMEPTSANHTNKESIRA